MHQPFGRRKVDIELEGNVIATILIRFNLLACERHLPFQPWIFFSTLSLILKKAAFLERENWSGRPRCFPPLQSRRRPRRRQMEELWQWAVLGLKIILDLTKLISWPDQDEYCWRHWWMLEASSSREALNIIISSANIKCEMKRALWLIWIPFNNWGDSARNSNLVRTSEQRINKKGEMGSPWRRPRWGEKNPKVLPFKRMEYDTVETHC